ncbi:hypothetical protein D3C80_592530 [compost metagenome]
MLIPKKRLSEVGNRVRQKFNFVSTLLTPGAHEDFVLESGASAIVQRLRVSSPCVVEFFGTEDHSPIIDPTPYRFKAVAGHLMDDGTTQMSDGTVIKSRQYSNFINLEDPVKPRVYGRITNTQPVNATITLDLLFLTVED